MAEKKGKFEKFKEFWRDYGIATFFFIMLLIFATGMIVSWVREPQQEKFVFEVTGVTDSINATTLTSLHYECVQFCANRFSESGGKLTECYSQCASLGREQCGGENGKK